MSDSGTGPSMLVVEDDPPLLETLAEVLSAHGCTVVGCARDAATAQQLIAHQPDMALVDYQLRDGPCDDLLQALSDRGVQIVLMSGYTTDDLPEALLQYVMLHKPFDMYTLLDAVDQLAQAT